MGIFGSLATWVFWAFYAAGLAIMAITLVVHLHVAHMPTRGPWLLVAGAALGALGSIIGGMQAGPYPPMDAEHGVALVRSFWVLGITFGVIASGMYLWGIKERKP